MQSIDDRMGASVSKPRFTALLLSLFAALAIVLGIIGVYAVVACRVRWQVREVAVRQALGAQPRDVIRHVLRQGLAIIVPGIAFGLLSSLALGRFFASLLYEVHRPRPHRARRLLDPRPPRCAPRSPGIASPGVKPLSW